MNRKIKELIKQVLRPVGVLSLYTILRENAVAPKVFECRRRYAKHISRLRDSLNGRKIRVLFIVSEIAKWKEQSLYEEMESSGFLYPIVGLSAWNRQSSLSCEELEEVHLKASRFFERLGDRYVRTVTTKDGAKIFHDLTEFNPDIVFYTEPWSPCEKQSPDVVSKFALTYYVPYFVPNYGVVSWDCHQRFHQFLYGYFCLSESWVLLYKRSLMFTVHATKFWPTGHPALDCFYKERERKPTANFVIYAPHHSFPHKNRVHVQTYGTFEWNGMEMLAFAEAHPEINWVFKPHPVLRAAALEEGFMTEEELRSYYDRWRNIGVVCEDGAYQNLFLESRCMITDCGSFLSEYGSTKRPVIHLICSKNKFVPPKASKDVYDTYYQVRNLDELRKALKTVVQDGLDPMREVRVAAVCRAGLADRNASQNIVSHLREELVADE